MCFSISPNTAGRFIRWWERERRSRRPQLPFHRPSVVAPTSADGTGGRRGRHQPEHGLSTASTDRDFATTAVAATSRADFQTRPPTQILPAIRVDPVCRLPPSRPFPDFNVRGPAPGRAAAAVAAQRSQGGHVWHTQTASDHLWRQIVKPSVRLANQVNTFKEFWVILPYLFDTVNTVQCFSHYFSLLRVLAKLVLIKFYWLQSSPVITINWQLKFFINRLGLCSRTTDLPSVPMASSSSGGSILQNNFAGLSTAPFQGGPSAEATFESIVSQRYCKLRNLWLIEDLV